MNTHAIGRPVFPQPDFAAIRRHRQAIRSSVDSSDEGRLRAQQLAILSAMDRADVKTLEFLDKVRTTFQAFDMRTYTKALRQLDHGARTPEQNLAFLRYQQEAVAEMYGLVESVRSSLGFLDEALSALKSAVLVDVGEQMKRTRLLLEDPLLDPPRRRELGFLLEDLQGAMNMAGARSDYLEEVERMLVPVRFFCQIVFDTGEDAVQVASGFQQRVDELGDYMWTVRQAWLD
ncbi:hypothetical protein TRP66_21895 [Pseudomonas sp. JDS28PS106]|uniref:hypothetical protein n=1 Tax=Pseudomonas sp. JDS28PS106 TaxID=2497235 RepID=UPI002FD68D02